MSLACLIRRSKKYSKIALMNELSPSDVITLLDGQAVELK